MPDALNEQTNTAQMQVDFSGNEQDSVASMDDALKHNLLLSSQPRATDQTTGPVDKSSPKQNKKKRLRNRKQNKYGKEGNQFKDDATVSPIETAHHEVKIADTKKSKNEPSTSRQHGSNRKIVFSP